MLIILGDDLDPVMVSRAMALEPFQTWRKGERKELTRRDGSKKVFDSRHEWGGWKRLGAPEHRNMPLEAQLRAWCDALHPKIDAIAKLKAAGLRCALNAFIMASKVATIRIPENLQRDLAGLGLELEIDFWAEDTGEPTAPGIPAPLETQSRNDMLRKERKSHGHD